MKLSWLMRLRIAAAVATGVVLIGFLAWPLVAPAEPFAVVSLLGETISIADTIALAGLAFLAGLLAYFLSWPHGREIGILAVPAGLSVWAVRCGSMAGLMQLNPTLARRQALFATLRWEPVFWLALVAAGFVGVLLGQKIAKQETKLDKSPEKSNSNMINKAIALLGSVLIAQFFISILAQDLRVFDSKLGSVAAQPATGQIVFAVLVSFGVAAFAVKKFLNVGYIWPIIAGALVTGFAITTYGRQDVLQYLLQRWPATFFSNSVNSILPVQMVAFGTLGSIAGYWLAVRYNYWRKHELK